MGEEFLLFLLGLALVGLVLLPVVAVIMLAGIRRRLTDLAARQDAMSRRLDVLGVARAAGAASRPEAPAVAAETPRVPEAAVPSAAPVAAPSVPRPPPPPPAPAPARPRPAAPVPPTPVPVPSAEPSEPGAAAQILRRIWRWILMGGEERARGVTREFAIASWWLLIVGIVAVVACAAFFLRWSIERELIGPAGRVALTVFFGVGMLVVGMRLLGRKYHIMGQGLLGGGLLTLYFSVFAAGSMYGLAPIPAAFALMILVTVTAGVLSVRANSLLVAVLGLAGGYMTPVMLRTPEPNLAVFYAYVLLLGIGIMGVARYREWRVLNYLGFAFTYALFQGSLRVYTRADFPMALAFLAAFFVVHSLICYVHNIARAKSSTALEAIHLTLNAVLFAGFAYRLIQGAHGRPYPALMSLALAVFYMLHVAVFIRRRLVDRRLLVTLIALAGVFAAWTLPLVMEKESLTIALALLAFMFLWLGGRLGSEFIANLGHVLYGVVFVRLVWMDLPRNFRGGGVALAPMGEYWKAMLDRLWTFGTSLASVVAAFALERRRGPAAGLRAVPAASDTPRVVPAGAAAQAFYWFAALFGFAFAHLEVNAMLRYGEAFRLPVLTLLWCAMALYFMRGFLRGGGVSAAMFAAMCVFMTVGVVKLLAVDLRAWRLAEGLVYMADYVAPAACARLLDFACAVAALLAAWRLVGRRMESRLPAAVFGYGALLLFFVYASLETNSFLYWKLRRFQDGGVSILWALFAAAFVAGGIWKSLKPLRYGGLALFAVVVGKVFLVDLSEMEIIHRVIAFMIVGLALLLGSFAYIFAGRKFEKGSQ
ncbi:MAG: DUF2339 domain-containing protein [Lentisphaerae bacterium]|nr:DUF2339 domain-containing protein [Lentisphaerota bacterium]